MNEQRIQFASSDAGAQITRDRNDQKLACASGQTTANSLTQAINEARDRGDIELLERIAKDPQAFILKQGWGWRGLAAGRMPMDGESSMPREAGWTRLGLSFRDPLTCAPGGSAPPSEELRSLYEHLQARILEMIEPSSLVLRRAKDASSTACGETPQLRDIHRSAGRIATIFTSQTA